MYARAERAERSGGATQSRVAPIALRETSRGYKDYDNPRTAVIKDSVTRSVMPDQVSACALTASAAGANPSCGSCLRAKTLERVAQRVGLSAADASSIKERTHCTNDRCILDRARDMGVITDAEAEVEQQLTLKQDGPTGNDLFSDSVIHGQLYAWMYAFADFWAYNFNMLNFATRSIVDGEVISRPDTLASINWRDLYEGRVPFPRDMRETDAARAMIAAKRKSGVRCSACVINSDRYEGRGKHWMALFVDARSSERWTIEFFNSAGMAPATEWATWMDATRAQLEQIRGHPPIELICVCDVWSQKTMTECGPYSLFYIWSRLNGVAPEYFLRNAIPDQIPIEFRQHLFAKEIVSGAFDFAEYARTTQIKWAH